MEPFASGIPVIAHPTPGLVESLGDARIFAYRDDLNAWIHALRSLRPRRTGSGTPVGRGHAPTS
ncbi:hypothetical protein [Streptomyces halobius]|uniref:Glycosyl transferase family 1 n=1 Tax=Streptomyces halobius TaxID=2879846 RepID=A0ABY4M2A5_9ACTN|nr:hypothetical protein [Streptomyces halobius]UQA91872.1 hypothetical protein K9S39_08400 [Streptomyces halobius]